MLLTGYDLSLLGLLIQTVGIGILALLFLLLYRILPRSYFHLWGYGWTAMALGLLALYIALNNASPRWPWEFLYFFGEYLFAYCLYEGLLLFPSGTRRVLRRDGFVVVLALVVSLVLAQLTLSFGGRFGIHALIFSVSLMPSLWRVWHLNISANQRWVKYFVFIVLLALFTLFLANGSGLFVADIIGERWYAIYSAYQSILDLMIESLLAFALLSTAAVDTKVTLERANQALHSERDRMVMLAHQDAMTGCFNRLALTELQQRISDRRGIVALIDLNNLKPINDQHGHQVGDMAICRVANALKSRMRGHDHIFRIGGDEFLLVAFNMSQDEARQRLQHVQKYLLDYPLAALQTSTLSIAWGIAVFDAHAPFEQSITQADQTMYQHKRVIRHVQNDHPANGQSSVETT